MNIFRRFAAIADTYNRRTGAWGSIPFFLLTIAAIFFVPEIGVGSKLSAYEPDSAEYLELRSLLGNPTVEDSSLVIFFPEDLFSPDSEQRLKELSINIKEAPGVNDVFSPVDLSGESTSPGWLKRSLEGDNLARQIFLSPDGRSISIYVHYDDYRLTIPAVEELVNRMDDAVFFDQNYYGSYIQSRIVGQLLRWLALATAVILGVHYWFIRSLRHSLALLITAVMPAMWTLALIAVFVPVATLELILVPLEVFILATSFGVHLYQHKREINAQKSDGVFNVQLVVSLAAGTTLAGVLSLSWSVFAEIRTITFWLAAGIGLALFASIFVLPSLLSLFTRKPNPPHPGLERFIDSASRRGRAAIVSALVVFSVFISQIPMVMGYFGYDDAFGRISPLFSEISVYRNSYSNRSELELLIDSGREYGLVDPAALIAVKELTESLDSLPEVTATISYADVVDWYLRSDGAEPGSPAFEYSDVIIGESLELSKSSRAGILLDSLIDRSYQKARVRIFYVSADGSRRSMLVLNNLVEHIKGEFAAEFEIASGMTLRPSGWGYLRSRSYDYQIEDQIRGILLYLAIISPLLLISLRSLRLWLISLVPVIFALTLFFGAMGLLGIPNKSMMYLMSAIVMGVSIDDSLVLMLAVKYGAGPPSNRIPNTLRLFGPSIVQTTVLLCAGLGVLFFTEYRYLAEASFLTIFALIGATLVTIAVLPVLLQQWLTSKEKSENPGPKESS